jgi:hypothetical protein
VAAAVAAVSVAFADGDSPGLRLPDLDQLAPYDVSLHEEDGRTLLVFASAVANVGSGPLIVEGRRPAVGMRMTVRQVVVTTKGARRAARVRSQLRYTRSPDHSHWHLLRFDRYELRRAADGALVAPDKKTGFCLGDRKRLIPAPRGTARRPTYTSRCGLGQPALLSIREGISVGYLDDYKPLLEGQSFDVTDLEPGRYVLVHRANADGDLREESTENNAASVLLELTPDAVRVLASCPDTAECTG